MIKSSTRIPLRPLGRVLAARERGESRSLLRPQNYVELEDTGHFSILEAPEKAANIIKSHG